MRAAPNVNDRVEICWPGLAQDGKRGTVIERPSKTIAKVRFGDGREALMPISKLRRLI